MGRDVWQAWGGRPVSGTDLQPVGTGVSMDGAFWLVPRPAWSSSHQTSLWELTSQWLAVLPKAPVAPKAGTCRAQRTGDRKRAQPVCTGDLADCMFRVVQISVAALRAGATHLGASPFPQLCHHSPPFSLPPFL